MKKIISFILTVTMMLTAVSVFAADVSQKSYPQSFWDVPKNHWAYEYIAELTNRGVISGYEDGSFRPNNTVTRAEWAKIMVLAAELPTSDNSVNYKDMQNHWANIYVNATNNYLGMYKDGTFRPDEPTLREHVSAALVCLLGCELSFDDRYFYSKFSDHDSITASLSPYINAAIKYNLVSGFDDGTFRGQDTLTRAEAAALLCEAFYENHPNVKSINTVRSYDVEEYPYRDEGQTSIRDIDFGCGVGQDGNDNFYILCNASIDQGAIYRFNSNGIWEKLIAIKEIAVSVGNVTLTNFVPERLCYDKQQDGLLIFGTFHDTDSLLYQPINKKCLFLLRNNKIQLLSADCPFIEIYAAFSEGYMVLDTNNKVSYISKDFTDIKYLKLDDADYHVKLDIPYIFDGYTNIFTLEKYKGLNIFWKYTDNSNESKNIYGFQFWDNSNQNDAPYENKRWLRISDNLCIASDSSGREYEFYDFYGKRLKKISRAEVDLDDYFYIGPLVFISKNNDLIFMGHDKIKIWRANYGD